MSKASPSEELKRWKDKYFSLQEQYDEDKDEADEFRTTLQRLLLRICLSAEGQNATFDQELKNVREAVKDPKVTVSQLTTRIDNLNKSLVLLDDMKDEHAKEFADTLSGMVDHLKELNPPRAEKSSLKQLSKLLSKDGLRSERFIPLLKDYSSAQSAVLSAVVSPVESKGLMGRLFGSSSKTIESPSEDSNVTDASEPNEPETEQDLNLDASEKGDQFDQGEQVPGFSSISTHVRGTLNHLLKQLSFPPSSERALTKLKEKISRPLNWYELGPTLDDVANIVISAVGKGQRDISSFLSNVDDRLNKLQSVVLDVLQIDSTMREEEKRLDAAVRDQIGNISFSLENEEDLESLKSSIQKQMDSISDVLDHFSEASIQADANKEKELERMQERFDALEEQTLYFRERLKEERSKALTDALTKLPNREAFDDRFLMEYERWKRYGKDATLVVADVDHFKKINDEYGHLSGDKVLQILAKELQSRLRKTDFIARYGGEEFVFILPETGLDRAQDVMNKTRETISTLPFHFRDERVTVTLSFGLVGFAEGRDLETLFDMADQALYKAKGNGRNRVEVAEDA